jgi:hypothetical protein
MLAHVFVPALIITCFAVRFFVVNLFKKDPELSRLMKQAASA